MKKIYVFQCNGNDKIYGYSLEDTGKSIPLKFCGNGWKFLQEMDISRESEPLVGESAINILNGIELNGYHVAGVETDFAERTQ